MVMQVFVKTNLAVTLKKCLFKKEAEAINCFCHAGEISKQGLVEAG